MNARHNFSGDLSPDAQPMSLGSGACKRALIVDDDLEIQSLLTLLLTRQGFTVQVASGLQDLALNPQCLQAELILLDFHLGDFSGIEVMQFLHEKHIDSNIILISGCTLSNSEIALKAGCAQGLNMLGFLAKPLRPSALRHMISQYTLVSHPLTANDLIEAMHSQRFFLAYQPKLNLATGKISGVEALARWQDPRRGIVPPDRFIPLAETNQQIVPLTWHLLDLAFHQKALWHAAGHTFDLAVNVPPQMILEPDCLVKIDRLASHYNVDLSHIDLEITESAGVECLSYARHQLGGLRERGCTLSMDDFGTGYSSMAQLYRLPFDQIKVDRVFVSASDQNAEARAITTSIVELGQRLNLQVVAEGIETPAQHEFLKDLRCDFGQGYLFARPMPASDLTGWLAHHYIENF